MMTEKAKHAGGRPSKFTPELADKICRLVATTPVGLHKICAFNSDLPTPETIRVWRWEKVEFSANYAKAKQFQAEIMAESIEDITDDLKSAIVDELGFKRIDSGIVSLARLTSDNRKWTAGKLAPKIYGDHKQLEELKYENDRVKEELAALKSRLDKENIKEY
jgi:hypothetical protein